MSYMQAPLGSFQPSPMSSVHGSSPSMGNSWTQYEVVDPETNRRLALNALGISIAAEQAGMQDSFVGNQVLSPEEIAKLKPRKKVKLLKKGEALAGIAYMQDPHLRAVAESLEIESQDTLNNMSAANLIIALKTYLQCYEGDRRAEFAPKDYDRDAGRSKTCQPVLVGEQIAWAKLKGEQYPAKLKGFKIAEGKVKRERKIIVLAAQAELKRLADIEATESQKPAAQESRALPTAAAQRTRKRKFSAANEVMEGQMARDAQEPAAKRTYQGRRSSTREIEEIAAREAKKASATEFETPTFRERRMPAVGAYEKAAEATREPRMAVVEEAVERYPAPGAEVLEPDYISAASNDSSSANVDWSDPQVDYFVREARRTAAHFGAQRNHVPSPPDFWNRFLTRQIPSPAAPGQNNPYLDGPDQPAMYDTPVDPTRMGDVEPIRMGDYAAYSALADQSEFFSSGEYNDGSLDAAWRTYDSPPTYDNTYFDAAMGEIQMAGGATSQNETLFDAPDQPMAGIPIDPALEDIYAGNPAPLEDPMVSNGGDGFMYWGAADYYQHMEELGRGALLGSRGVVNFE